MLGFRIPIPPSSHANLRTLFPFFSRFSFWGFIIARPWFFPHFLNKTFGYVPPDPGWPSLSPLVGFLTTSHTMKSKYLENDLHRTNMPSKWDSYDILDLDESRTTCYGWATSQDRQCQNPVARANRQEAEQLLGRISRLDLGNSYLHGWLMDLASRILCQRYHQGQAMGVVGQWEENVRRFLGNGEEKGGDEERERVSLQVATETVPRKKIEKTGCQHARIQKIGVSTRNYHERLDASSSSTRLSASGAQSTRYSDGALFTRSVPGDVGLTPPITPVTEPRRTSIDIPRQPNNSERLSDSTSEVTQAEPQTSTTNNVASRRTSQCSADSAAPVTPSPSGSETPLNPPVDTPTLSQSLADAIITQLISLDLDPEHGAVNLPPVESSGKSSKSPIEPKEPENAVLDTQRSLSGDCSICYADLLDGKNLASCQAQCRQYFHQKCIGTWLRQKQERTCPYWYVLFPRCMCVLLLIAIVPQPRRLDRGYRFARFTEWGW